MEAGTEPSEATRFSGPSSAKFAIGSVTNQIDHSVYGKPGALVLG